MKNLLFLSHWISDHGNLAVCWKENTVLASSLTQTLDEFSQRIHTIYPDVMLEEAPFSSPLHRWLETYHEGRDPGTFPMIPAFCGTAFRERVWKALQEIPYGELRSYGDIAQRIGCRSARPVGQAVGANPLPLFVPCHRVVASGNGLGGFSSGIENKIRLLKLEGWQVSEGKVLPA